MKHEELHLPQEPDALPNGSEDRSELKPDNVVHHSVTGHDAEVAAVQASREARGRYWKGVIRKTLEDAKAPGEN